MINKKWLIINACTGMVLGIINGILRNELGVNIFFTASLTCVYIALSINKEA